MLSEAREEIVKADQKAMGIMGTLGIGFGAVAGGLLAAKWTVSSLSGIRVWTWWSGVALEFLAVSLCTAVIWPRYKKPNIENGVTYWGHVASFKSFKLFNDAMENHGVVESNRTRDQLWAISLIVKKKYQLLRCSLIMAAIGVALLLFTAFFVSQKK